MKLGRTIAADNFHTSLELANFFLLKKENLLVGTARKNWKGLSGYVMKISWKNVTSLNGKLQSLHTYQG